MPLEFSLHKAEPCFFCSRGVRRGIFVIEEQIGHGTVTSHHQPSCHIAMPVDFPLAALHRYLWDHLTEIIPATTATTRQQGQVFSSPGVSNAWATGAGYEGFDNFRVELEKFSGGQSNPTFMLFIHLSPPPALRPQGTPHNGISGANGIEATATRQPPKTEYRFVLRKKPASVNVSSAHAVEREFRVLRALQQTNVPVPDVLLLCEDLSIIGTPFYVMEFVNGRVFSDSSLPGMSRHDRFAAYASAAETLARIHGVDFVSVGLEGYGRSKGGYFGRQVATLERVAMKQVRCTWCSIVCNNAVRILLGTSYHCRAFIAVGLWGLEPGVKALEL